jgi:hypothetical protein
MTMSSVGKSGPQEQDARHINLTVFLPHNEGQQ